VAFDLFAGTGAMGLEAMSRGATRAYLIERHFPTVKIIRENVAALNPEMNVQIAGSDTFFWARRFLKDTRQWPSEPWIVFCCPPYDLYVKQTQDLLDLVRSFKEAAPQDSLIIVESDQRFDVEQLPCHEEWTVRKYAPAVISIFKKFV
jgi:16S rRNA (guanine966-N2)-methyltransferase